MGISVEHDDRVGQHIGHVSALERLGVAQEVALGELLHQSVNLLSLPRQAEAGEEGSDGVVKVEA